MNKNIKIYVSGGSGLGKSTFTQRLSKKLDLEYKSEGCRDLYDTVTDFLNQDFLYRQELLVNLYRRLYEYNGSFVSDRSVLEIICWTLNYSLSLSVEELARHANGLLTNYNYNTSSNNIYVIVPTPNIEIYKSIYESHIKTDPFRLDTFKEVIKTYSDDTDLMLKCRYIALYTELVLENYLRRFDITIIKPSYEENNYFESWQDSAYRSIKEVLDND